MNLSTVTRESGAPIVNDYRFIRTGDDRCMLVFLWNDDGSPEMYLSMTDQAWREAMAQVDGVLSEGGRRVELPS